MQSIPNLCILGALPLLQVLLWIVWLYVCGAIINQGKESYGREFLWWNWDGYISTWFLIVLWTAIIFVIYIVIELWHTNLLREYLFPPISS